VAETNNPENRILPFDSFLACDDRGNKLFSSCQGIVPRRFVASVCSNYEAHSLLAFGS